MIDDVVVGSVGKMTVDNWHADVEVSVKPDVVVPANAGRHRRADQPARVDASGAQPAARATADRQAAARCHPRR